MREEKSREKKYENQKQLLKQKDVHNIVQTPNADDNDTNTTTTTKKTKMEERERERERKI